MKKAMLIGALLASSQAFAVPYTFDYQAIHDTSDWEVSGSVSFDVAAGTTGSLDVGSSITGWDFTWTDGTTSFSTSSTLESLFNDNMVVNFDTLSVDSWNLCSGACNPSDAPEIGLQSGFGPYDVVDFTLTDVTFGQIASPLQWTQTWTYDATDTTAVAEPGTFALFGLGLVGLGLTRRRKA